MSAGPRRASAEDDAAFSPGGWFYRARYTAAWLTCEAVFRPWFRYRVERRPAIDGGCVVVANHTSYLDPLLLGAAMRRPCVFLMTAAFYDEPRFRWLYRAFRAIPVVQRGGNRTAMRRARDELGAGRAVAVFPEGGISRDGGLYLGSPGAVSLVLGAGVPIVPAAIVGAQDAFPLHRRWPRARRITVRFGDPIDLAELAGPGGGRKQQLARATLKIMREIAALGGTRAREDELRALGRPVPAE